MKNNNILYIFVSSYQKLYNTIAYIIKGKENTFFTSLSRIITKYQSSIIWLSNEF